MNNRDWVYSNEEKQVTAHTQMETALSDGEKNDSRSSAVDEQQIHTVEQLTSIVAEKDKVINQLTKKLAQTHKQLEKANNFNEDLRQEITKLSLQIHQYRNLSTSSVETQVYEANIDGTFGEKPMPEWVEVSGQAHEFSIGESLKAAVEDELHKQQQKEADDQQQLKHDTEICEASSEYVYDASSGFYYHPGTGYYWDPNSGLFYDYTTATYFQYNEQTGEYEVHSRIDGSERSEGSNEIKKGSQKRKKERASSNTQKKATNKKRLKRRYKSSKLSEMKSSTTSEVTKAEVNLIDDENTDHDRNTSLSPGHESEAVKCEAKNVKPTQISKAEGNDIENISESECESSGSLATGESELVSEMESGELSSSDSSSCEDSEAEVEETPTQIVFSSGPVSSDIIPANEMTENYPPCVRIIVQESSLLDLGLLFIITCAGGTIGREKGKGHAIEINENSVSKMHAQIEYDYEKNCYILTDKGSQNGTILNGKRIAKSCTRPLQHSDILQIGSTKLLLHIHKGSETCDDCEPGQVQARLKAMNPIKNNYTIQSQEEKNRQRRKELKNIKKKYGLQNSYFENDGAIITNPDYSDKAHLRRKFIGSEIEIPKQNEAPASVERPISTSNKGHKLLAKMGWKEGQGLGKINMGITEPINVEMRVNQNAGLGSATGASLSLDKVQDAGKAKRWSQARQRYQQLEETVANRIPVQENQSQTNCSSKTTAVHSEKHMPKQLPDSATSIRDRGNPLSDSSDVHIPPSSSGDLSFVNVNPYNLTTNAASLVSSSGNGQSPKQVFQTSKPRINWIKGETEQLGNLAPETPLNEQSRDIINEGKNCT